MFEWVKNEKLRTFLYRVWNVVKYPTLAVLGGVAVIIIKDMIVANTVTIVANWQYWDTIAIEALKILALVLGIGVSAGGEKLVRDSKAN